MMILEQILNNAQNKLSHIADGSGSALFQGDCLDIMPLIPDKSVQLILADLPYGTTACKWDSIIDLELLWKQYKRIIKPNGAIVLTASQPFTTKLISSNYAWFKYEWIWDKGHSTNFMLSKKQPLKYHENILVFSNKQHFYNPIKTKREKDKDYTGSKNEYKNNNIVSRIKDTTKNLRTHLYPKSIQYFSSQQKECNNLNRLHPTQKPLELMKYLISTYSNENDMVLDNTMGSGTTCLAAKELNRKFIGIEKEVKYYDVAVARVFG